MKRSLILLLALAATVAVGTGVLGAWRQSPLDEALRQALRKDDEPAVRLLLSKGADPNTLTDLHLTVTEWALSHDQREIADDLLRAGGRVDPDAQLLFAAGRSESPIVRLLLQRGANVNVRDDQGRTPLMLAWDSETVQVLLESGAEVNTAHPQGRTALVYRAAEIRDRKVIPLLLQHGADPRVKDPQGRKAVDLARAQGELDIAQLLDHYERRFKAHPATGAP